jgi:hypothetical protein
MINRIKITECPGSIRKFAMQFPDTVHVYECDCIVSLFTKSKDFPLTMALIAQTDCNKTVERYFLIGMALPSGVDKFTFPLLYFTAVLPEQYDRLVKFIKEYAKNPSVIWTEESPA